MPTDHGFTSLVQSTPHLIALLLQAAGEAQSPSLPPGPDSPGNQLACFEAVELRAVNHTISMAGSGRSGGWPAPPGSQW